MTKHNLGHELTLEPPDTAYPAELDVDEISFDQAKKSHARSGHRVLVIEDEADIREGLRDLLELKGYTVDTAENGLSALQILESPKQPCIVLLDLMMPLMTGWEFCAELRKQERLADLPIVIVSGMVGTEYAEIPHTIARMSKPVDIERLCSLIEEIARSRFRFPKCWRPHV